MKLSRRSIFALIAGALASPAMARVKPFATGGVVPAGPRYLVGELCSGSFAPMPPSRVVGIALNSARKGGMARVLMGEPVTHHYRFAPEGAVLEEAYINDQLIYTKEDAEKDRQADLLVHEAVARDAPL